MYGKKGMPLVATGMSRGDTLTRKLLEERLFLFFFYRLISATLQVLL
jgi:hypothetical protein